MEEKLAVPDSAVNRQVAQARLIIGLLQGFLLYLLYRSAQDHVWPATEREIFAPLLLVLSFIPVLLISGLGHLNKSQLARWAGIALPVIWALGYYDIWRGGGHAAGWLGGPASPIPSPLLFIFTGIALFIGQALVLAASVDRRRFARYPTYFEISWKLAIQLIFSQWFIGALWVILWIGAALFMLIKLDFLTRLLTKPWFFIPVTALAFSAAFHLTDVRPAIVRGIRTLLLVLMSWLLPLATLIVLGFMLGLLASGLAPLWATHNATAILLGTAAVLILLVNATYQNGEIGGQISRILRHSARIAAALLTPIVAIGIYALWLRVQDYGWTTDRLIAAACLLIAACYAAGYLWAAVDRTWLGRIAPSNVFTSFAILAVLLSLFSPIADPARVSVASQIARLDAGKVRADRFDFDYLKFEGARYGANALAMLKASSHGPDAALIREKAEAALNKHNRWEQRAPARPASAQEIAANIHVRTSGATLPQSFLKQGWASSRNPWQIPQCLKAVGQECDAYLIDFNHDGIQEILLIGSPGRENNAPVFMLNAAGTWDMPGTLQIRSQGAGACGKNLLEKLAGGDYRLAAPLFSDLEIGGQRLIFMPNNLPANNDCREQNESSGK